ncbi:hypothetical protein [Algoriphagus limi]|uniref:Uncharacterized protein n=1 Tax=Algoriphagus limi TaxID=2975273 RepID=A0ABT2G1F6_9BACT|nr:hypothetical protein [Algoriphagus limi]MCS5488907.1 hypothetical protein [Algoriphagus limi]
MNKSRIQSINSHYRLAVGKYYVMHAGLSSSLLSYNKKEIRLLISYDSRWKKDPATTAYQVAKSWKTTSKALAKAETYHVTIESKLIREDQKMICTVMGKLDEE